MLWHLIKTTTGDRWQRAVGCALGVVFPDGRWLVTGCPPGAGVEVSRRGKQDDPQAASIVADAAMAEINDGRERREPAWATKR